MKTQLVSVKETVAMAPLKTVPSTVPRISSFPYIKPEGQPTLIQLNHLPAVSKPPALTRLGYGRQPLLPRVRGTPGYLPTKGQEHPLVDAALEASSTYRYIPTGLIKRGRPSKTFEEEIRREADPRPVVEYELDTRPRFQSRANAPEGSRSNPLKPFSFLDYNHFEEEYEEEELTPSTYVFVPSPEPVKVKREANIGPSRFDDRAERDKARADKRELMRLKYGSLRPPGSSRAASTIVGAIDGGIEAVRLYHRTEDPLRLRQALGRDNFVKVFPTLRDHSLRREVLDSLRFQRKFKYEGSSQSRPGPSADEDNHGLEAEEDPDTDEEFSSYSRLHGFFSSLKMEIPNAVICFMVELTIAKDLETIAPALRIAIASVADSLGINFTSVLALIMRYLRALTCDDPSSEGITYEGVGEMNFAVDLLKMFRHSPLSMKVMAVITGVVGSAIFAEDKAFGTTFTETVWGRLLDMNRTVFQPLEAMGDLVQYFVDRQSVYNQSGNWRDLFGKPADVEALEELDRVSELMESARSEPTKLRSVVEETVRAITKAQKQSRSALVVHKLEKVEARLKKFQQGLEGDRIPPAGFIIVGPSGCGKTVLTSQVHAIMKQKYGYEPEDNIVFKWMNTKFQSIPTVARIVLMNDAFTSKAEYADQDYVELLQRLTDSVTGYAEGASIEEKANQNFAHTLTMVSTNTVRYSTSKSVPGASSKLDRRYKVMEFSFSEHCIAESERTGLTCPELLKKRPKDANNLVHIDVGDMVNGDTSPALEIVIRRNKVRLPSFHHAADYILSAEAACREESPMEPYQLCSGCGRMVCYESCAAGENYSALAEPIEYEGSTHSIQHGVSPSVTELWATVTSDVVRAWSAFKEDVATAKTQVSSDWKKVVRAAGARLFGSLIVVASIVIPIAAAYRAFRTLTASEGAILSSPSFPEEKVNVQPYAATDNAWLGIRSNCQYPISRKDGKLRMTSLLVTHNLLVIPFHFFNGVPAQGGDAAVPPMAPGEEFSISYPTGELVIRYEPSVVFRHEGDLSFLFVASLPSIASTAFARLPMNDTLPSEMCRMGEYPPAAVEPGWTWDVPSKAGDCGLAMTGMSGTIYAFHYGKQKQLFKTRAIAHPLSKASVRAAIAHFEALGNHMELYSDDRPTVAGETLLEGLHPRSDAAWIRKQEGWELKDHLVLGHLPSADKSNFTGVKTKLAPIFEDMAGEKFGLPHAGKAVPVDGVWSSPVVTRMSDAAPRRLSNKLMLESIELALEEIPMPDVEMHPLTDHQSLCGDARNVLINCRDSSKSIGYSAAKAGVKKNNGFRELGPNNFALHPFLTNHIERVEAHLRSPEPLEPGFVKASRKDEILPMRKVLKGGYRNFYVCDFADNHVLRKALLPPLAHLMAHPYQSGMNVTMNASSPQWEQAFKYLRTFGDDLYDMDQEAFDLRHDIMIHYVGSFVRQLCTRVGYTPDEARFAHRAFLRTFRYVLILEGNFFLCSSRLPSGTSMTIQFNCLVLKLATVYAVRKSGYMGSPSLWISMLSTGDDLVLGQHHRFTLDGEKWRAIFLELGYVVTDGNKEKVIRKKPFTEVPYLKRTTTPEGKGALALSSIFRSLTWMVGTPPEKEDERNRATAMSACHELYLHGEEVFERIMSLIREHVPQEYPSYADLDMDYRGGQLRSSGAVAIGDLSPWDNPQEVIFEGLACMSRDGFVVSGPHNIDHPSEKAKEGKRVVGFECPRVPAKQQFRAFDAAALSLINRIATTNEIQAVTPAATSLNSVEVSRPADGREPVTDLTYLTREEVKVSLDPTQIRLMQSDQTGVKDYLMRPRKVGEFSILADSNFSLYRAWRNLTEVDYFMKRWSLQRSKMHVTLKYVGGSQYMGKYRVSFTPEKKHSPPYNFSPIQPVVGTTPPIYTHQLPHADVDVNGTMDTIVELPYAYSEPYQSTNVHDEWWAQGNVINTVQLANGNTPAPLKIEVWVAVEADLEVVVFEGLGDAPEASPGVVSSLLSYSSGIAAKIGGSWMSAASSALGLGSVVARWAGYTRPTAEAQLAVKHVDATSFGPTSGTPNFSHTFALDPAVSSNVGTVFPLQKEGDTTVTFLASQWGDRRQNWAAETIVPLIPTEISPIGGRYWMDPLSFVSNAFTYWTGELEVCVEVLSSPLVRWKIGIVILPPGKLAPISFPTDGTHLTYIVDVVGSTCKEITVPWLHHEQFRRGSSVVSDATHIVYYSLMDPTGPSATPVVPAVNLFVRAGDSFGLGVPSLDHLIDFKYEGLGEDSLKTFGEEVEDTVLLTRRVCLLEELVGSALRDGVAVPVMPHTPHNSTTFDNWIAKKSYFNFLTYFSPAYMGEVGGWEYKAFDKLATESMLWEVGTRIMIGGDVTQAEFDEMNIFPRGAMAYQNPGLHEFSIPDRNPSVFRVPGSRVLWDGSEEECIVISTDAHDWNIKLFMSGRDDYRYGGFLAVPPLIIH